MCTKRHVIIQLYINCQFSTVTKWQKLQFHIVKPNRIFIEPLFILAKPGLAQTSKDYTYIK